MSPSIKDVTKAITVSLTALGCAASMLACGGTSSNNDQGTSVTATGFCSDATCETRVAGVVAPLSTNSNALGGGFPLNGQRLVVAMEFQNRLTEQFFRVDRIDCNYTVPGADPALRIPTDSSAVGVVLEALGSGGTSTIGAEFPILTPDIYAFFNANENLLPQLPFRAIATCAGVGVTQAGDTLTTNSLNLAIQFGEVAGVVTGANGETTGADGGFQQGPGTGGDINTFSDDDGDDVGTGPANTSDEAQDGELEISTDGQATGSSGSSDLANDPNNAPTIGNAPF